MEKLPTEMKVAILAAMPDLDTLRSITRAVPGYFTAFKGGRREILLHVLPNGLSPEMLGEACLLQTATQIQPGKNRRKDVKAFLTSYKFGRALGVALSDQDENVLQDIATAYLRMERLVSAHRSLAILSRPNLLGNPNALLPDTSPLSTTEKTRFLRAFYRFDIMCQLFGTRYPDLDDRESNQAQQHSRFPSPFEFLRFMDSWEVEEMNCVRQHLQDFYHGLLQRHSAGLGVRFGDSKYAACERVITSIPFRQFLFGYEGTWYKEGAEHCTAFGLLLFSQLMDAKSEKKELELLERHAFREGMRLNSLMNDVWRNSTFRGPSHPRQGRDGGLRVGDDVAAPNAGLIWSRDPSRCYNIGLDESLNCNWLLSWAYAMWDRERLDKWGILRSDHLSFQGAIAEFKEKRRKNGDRII